MSNSTRSETLAKPRQVVTERATDTNHQEGTNPTTVDPQAVPDIASVPPREVFDSYVGRQVGGQDYMNVFGYARAHHVNCLIEGPTGSGKTHAARAYAAHEGMRFYSVSSSIGLEPSQLFGKYIPNTGPGGGFVWQDGPVTSLVRHGGLLLLNEVNFIPERVGTVLFSLLDSRREIQLVDHKAEVIKAHPDLLIVADMNPDYAGTRALNAAFRNRFGIQLSWGYDTDIEAKLIASATLRKMAAQLRKSHAEGKLETPISTNALMEFERMGKALGLDFARYNYVQHFAEEERAAVDKVFDTYKHALRTEFEVDEDKAGEHDSFWGIEKESLNWVYEIDGSNNKSA